MLMDVRRLNRSVSSDAYDTYCRERILAVSAIEYAITASKHPQGDVYNALTHLAQIPAMDIHMPAYDYLLYTPDEPVSQELRDELNELCNRSSLVLAQIDIDRK